jgi:hypothetical protein
MIDSDLIEELDAVSAQTGGVTKLSADAAGAYVQGIATLYVADQTRLRWWESLKVPTERFIYGDADGLSKLAELVENQKEVLLVVTDDEEPPWSVYGGDMRNIINILRGCRFFEYILVAQDMSWIVFDTHLNELVCAGKLAA